MQLNAQDIHSFCDRDHYDAKWWRWHAQEGVGPVPMISPFHPTRTVIRGRSAGLSTASYDCRIASDLTLGVHPGFTIARAIADRQPGESFAMWADKYQAALTETNSQPSFSLANTLEDFAMPPGVTGYVVDKSTHARLFVSAFNTYLDPGWRGNLTIELVNLSDRAVILKSGDPICQVVFHFLTADTDRPYAGKYMDQPGQPVEAIFKTE